MGWFRDTFIGDPDRYNYFEMCIPQIPWKKAEDKKSINFYSKGKLLGLKLTLGSMKLGRSYTLRSHSNRSFLILSLVGLLFSSLKLPDEKIPIFLTIIMGLQHSFAMVGGLITPPLVIFRFTVCGFGAAACPELEQYAISAALITSGLCTMINVSKFAIPFSEKIFGRLMFVGAGVLSVMGTSFTFLPVFEISIAQMKNDGVDGRVAYGRMLGTSMVCCLLEVCFSVLPIRIVKNIFPPLVTAITVILIGVALIGTGMKYLGGGVVCAEVSEAYRFVCSFSRRPSACSNILAAFSATTDDLEGPRSSSVVKHYDDPANRNLHEWRCQIGLRQP